MKCSSTMLIFASRHSLEWRRYFTTTAKRYQNTSQGNHEVFKRSDPLRVLFCGSDSFSCDGLEALRSICSRQDGGNYVESIDVVVRPGKPTGRGMKKISHVPLKGLAEQLGLPIHQVDTFRGWESPKHVNLIVAMSFGLFVPPRLLRGAKYGGLNVHPSFLPDLRGPAPLHHLLLQGRSHFGVTVQTLDENRFDHGKILAQTPRPGMPISDECTLEMLSNMATKAGADMLRDSLVRGLHVPPLDEVGWKPTDAEAAGLRHAPKVEKADLEVDWAHWTREDVSRRLRVFGPGRLWSLFRRAGRDPVRVLIQDAETAPAMEGLVSGDAKHVACVRNTTSQLSLLQFYEDGDGGIAISLAGGGCLRVHRLKVAGDVARPAAQALSLFL